MTEIEAYIREWIIRCSEIRPELGGFAVCPYASTAKILVIDSFTEDIVPISGYDVIFYVVPEYFTLQDVQYWVSFYNNMYDEYVFLEDHCEYNTYINGIQTNNGKYNLILMQNREKLRKHRKILRNSEYYRHWSDEMLREILDEDYNIVENSG